MTPFHRWTRQLFGIWQIVIALIAIATVSHDVAIATHSQIDTAPAHARPSGATHAGAGERDNGTHESPLAAYSSTPDPNCPPNSCPQQFDCGLNRIINPISAPDLLATNATANGSQCLQSSTESGVSRITIAPLHPPGIRRALLQVFLN